MGVAIDRGRRHARQDHDHELVGVGADARRPRSVVLVGGIAGNFDASYRLGAGRDFVIEGDEYDSAFFDKTAKFLKYLPDIAVVNNIEFDHADIYPDVDADPDRVQAAGEAGAAPGRCCSAPTTPGRSR